MSTITRERAQEIFLGNGPEPTASEERELARMLLAAQEHIARQEQIIINQDESLSLRRAELQEYRKAGTTFFKLPPLNDALIEILGRPNFACIDIAGLLRRDGAEIQRKAEHEQAAVIHFLLNMYLKHGDGWIDAAKTALKQPSSKKHIGVNDFIEAMDQSSSKYPRRGGDDDK